MNENLTKYTSSEILIVGKIKVVIFWVVKQYVSAHSSKEHTASTSMMKLQAVCSSEILATTYSITGQSGSKGHLYIFPFLQGLKISNTIKMHPLLVGVLV